MCWVCLLARLPLRAQGAAGPSNPSSVYNKSYLSKSGVADLAMLKSYEDIAAATAKCRSRLGGGKSGAASGKNLMLGPVRELFLEVTKSSEQPDGLEAPWVRYITEVGLPEKDKRVKEIGDRFQDIITGRWYPARYEAMRR